MKFFFRIFWILYIGKIKKFDSTHYNDKMLWASSQDTKHTATAFTHIIPYNDNIFNIT